MTTEEKKVEDTLASKAKKVTKKAAKKVTKKVAAPKNFGDNFNGNLSKEDTCNLLWLGNSIVQADLRVAIEQEKLNVFDAKLVTSRSKIKEQELLLLVERLKLRVDELLREKESAATVKKSKVKEHSDFGKAMESCYGIDVNKCSIDLVDFTLVRD